MVAGGLRGLAVDIGIVALTGSARDFFAIGIWAYLAGFVVTLAATAVSGARFAVQQWLYVSDETGWLGVARVAMGWPLTILAALVVVWAWRRSTKRLVPLSLAVPVRRPPPLRRN